MTVETYGVEQLVADLQEGRCPCHGCEDTTAGARSYLMCGGHWRLVPADAKREVYEAVRRVNGIASRYEGADGAPQQARLADLYFEAETEMRECQLRAVIVSSERAGAWPEPVQSPTKSTPRKGASMEIQITNDGDGCAHVSIVNPSSGETIDSRVVNGGEQVTVTAVNAHEASDLVVGEVAAVPAPDAEGAGEAPAEQAEEGDPGAGQAATPGEPAGEAAGGECPPEGEDKGE